MAFVRQLAPPQLIHIYTDIKYKPDVVQRLSLVPVCPVGPSVIEELTLRHLGIISLILLLLVGALKIKQYLHIIYVGGEISMLIKMKHTSCSGKALLKQPF